VENLDNGGQGDIQRIPEDEKNEDKRPKW